MTWNTAGRFPTDRAVLVPLAIQSLGAEQMPTVLQTAHSDWTIGAPTCNYWAD